MPVRPEKTEHLLRDLAINTIHRELRPVYRITEQDPPAIYYGELQWYTVLRNDIKGFVPNPLYLGSYNLIDMYREA